MLTFGAWRTSSRSSASEHDGRLIVEPQAHDYGIARHLLKESRTYIKRQGKTAILDLHANGSLTKEYCTKYGFAELPSSDPAVAPMIYTG